MPDEIERVEGEVVDEPATMPETIEFKILEPTSETLITQIVWNKDEIIEAVKAKMELYKNNNYSDIKLAKADRAQLNKVIKAIEDKRKEIKKAFTEPYTKFENEVKGIVALIKEPVELIDKQVKAHEQKQKDEKKSQLRAQFLQSVKELGGYVSFEDVFEERYLNLTCTLASAWHDIACKLDHIREDLKTIEKEGGEKYAPAMKSAYLQNRDLTKAFAEKRRQQEIEAEDERLRKEKEAEDERRKQEIQKDMDTVSPGRAGETCEKNEDVSESNGSRVDAVEPVGETDSEKDSKASRETSEKTGTGSSGAQTGGVTAGEGKEEQDYCDENRLVGEPQTFSAAFRVYGTREQLTALAMHMRTCGLKFEAITGQGGAYGAG